MQQHRNQHHHTRHITAQHHGRPADKLQAQPPEPHTSHRTHHEKADDPASDARATPHHPCPAAAHDLSATRAADSHVQARADARAAPSTR
ncbi:hypothetical protein [Streptacidiphilus sp. PAMC 29251]